jgi:hypothetical protein
LVPGSGGVVVFEEVEGDEVRAQGHERAEEAHVRGQRQPGEVDPEELGVAGAVGGAVENSIGIMKDVFWTKGAPQVPSTIADEC